MDTVPFLSININLNITQSGHYYIPITKPYNWGGNCFDIIYQENLELKPHGKSANCYRITSSKYR